MKDYIKHHPWSIIEEGFVKENNLVSESLFSIGNGRFGQRANFEEMYSGESLQGNYVAGVYYPDKTRVGWWKNGYPEYFAKVLNAVNWIGLDIEIEGEKLDLNTCDVQEFKRELDMKHGLLKRFFTATLPNGKKVQVESERFCSIVNDEIGALKYVLTPLGFSGEATIVPYLDFDVVNQDSNYDEKFWVEHSSEIKGNTATISAITKKSEFVVSAAMDFSIKDSDGNTFNASSEISREKFVGCHTKIELVQGSSYTIEKHVSILSSQNHEVGSMRFVHTKNLALARDKGFDQLLQEQSQAWIKKWEESDIVIEGDIAAQQGIRFNIFQLNQTYTGEDPRLNIGPKGFTGEKYGGSTYWDTEAFCFPFYLSTADEHVAKNLLMYRYKHLERAIENAEKLGFSDGAALYPMVTMNGEECHNEWEITFEEIHRNAAIAYAIYEYVTYTGDTSYLSKGLEVLIGISRFWSQRVNFSEAKKQYVMLGVTGPNEYENNVHNNWYTNRMAVWTLTYTKKCLVDLEQSDSEEFTKLISQTSLKKEEEVAKWQHIIDNMYFPYDKERNVFLQQDNFLDKEIIPIADLDPKHRPLVQNWSWDRILRSCYIKQADVLQGLYVLSDAYDNETIQRNFDFYEPLTVHESSLSPCVHGILAAKLGMREKAYEMYLRTSRLDLDDYNNDTEDGCHTTSMAGSWLSIVRGFGGMKIEDERLSFDPFVPAQWSAYSFKIRFRAHVIRLKIDKKHIEIQNYSDTPIHLQLFGSGYTIEPEKTELVPSKTPA